MAEQRWTDEQALALLRERFPEPWEVDFKQSSAGWHCELLFPQMEWNAELTLAGYGDTELSAARACIAAWDEATKDDLVCCMEGHEPISLSSKRPCPLCAERALADRLAEALDNAKAELYRVSIGGDPVRAGEACKATIPVLIEHAERRGA